MHSGFEQQSDFSSHVTHHAIWHVVVNVTTWEAASWTIHAQPQAQNFQVMTTSNSNEQALLR